MARKNSNSFGARGGSYENPYARTRKFTQSGLPYPAPGANGPGPWAANPDTGPQRGVTKVVAVPGDPTFPHDEAEKELASYIGLKHPKSYRVGIHPAHDKKAPAPGQPVFEDGAA